MDFYEVPILLLVLVVLSVVLSSLIPIYARRRWPGKGTCIGCLLQPFVTIVVFFLLLRASFWISDIVDHWDTMVCVSNIEEDRDCHFEEMWYYKTDGSLRYEYDKHSNDHAVEACGSDSFGHDDTFERVDSTTAIVSQFNGTLTVYFDLKERTVTPVYYNKVLEVVSVDWDKVEKYFRKH